MTTHCFGAAVRPVAPYRGGKSRLQARLVDIIDGVEHRVYAEPFVGMGGVFLRRRRVAAVEVVNDRSRDIATFYRVVQRHYAAFTDLLRYQLTSRGHFEYLNRQPPDMLTDLERAARFFYLQTMAYGGKVAGRTFGADRSRAGRFNVLRLAPLLQDFHDRLAGVVIECLNYDKFIATYDAVDALMYLDPPYHGCERDYGEGLFGEKDFFRLKAILDQVNCRFILSLNDDAFTRQLFSGFEIRKVTTRYGLASGSKCVNELIVTNFSLQAASR